MEPRAVKQPTGSDAPPLPLLPDGHQIEGADVDEYTPVLDPPKPRQRDPSPFGWRRPADGAEGDR